MGARFRTAALRIATIALASTLGAGCTDQKGNGSFTGSTFPPLSVATVTAGNANEVYGVPVLVPGIVAGSTNTLGEYQLLMGHSEALVLLQTGGGSYLNPTYGTPTTLTSSLDENGIPYAALHAIVPFSEGNHLMGLVISPLSDLAATMAIGLHLTTGLPMPATADIGNNVVSVYFTEANGFVPFCPGAALWTATAPTPSALTNEVLIGLVTAGLSNRASALGLDLEGYLDVLGSDAADGHADGVIHAPYTSSVAVSATASTPGYPSDPLGEALADDIEDFLGSTQNRSLVTTATAQPLIDRLRAQEGRLLEDAPLVTTVTSPAQAGSRTVTIEGSGFQAGASVYFGTSLAKSMNVQSYSAIAAVLPDSFASGTAVYVTVVNSSGLRHSLRATITVP